MKRLVSFAVALAMAFSLVLVPGCGNKGNTTPDGNSSSSASTSTPADTSGSGSGSDGSASSSAPADEPQKITGGAADPEQQVTLPEPLTLDLPQQYGTEKNYTKRDATLSVRMNYPDGEVTELASAIESWADSFAAPYRDQLAAQNESGGNLNLGYGSYTFGNQLTGVILMGNLTLGHTIAPEKVLKTFTGDRLTGKVYALNDLLLDAENGRATLKSLAAEQMGVDASTLGDSLFDNWLFTDTGLRFYLDNSGTNFTEIPYADLVGIIGVPWAQQPIDPEKPMIALTFDDGPSKNTTHLLDLFALYGGNATFFVVGSRVGAYADIAARAANNGHEMAMHTYNHAKLTVLSAEEIQQEVQSTFDAVKQYTGYECHLLRPPGGACDDFVKSTVGAMGYALVNWSIDTEDWRTRNADSTYSVVMSEARDGGIVLCHDLYEATASSMDRVIPELLAQGYQLVTVSQLLSYNADGGAQAGKLYNQR